MRRLIAAPVVALLLLTLNPGTAKAEPARPQGLSGADTRVLNQYAADTWKSMDAMLFRETGLVADYIGGDLTPASRSRYTSPTNIGGYMWSAVVARDLGLISRREAADRIGKTLQTLQRLERHPASGMFYNWYDPLNGAKIRTWPDDGSPRNPFLSSVDNGWLAAALVVVRNVVPEQRSKATALLSKMDFGFFYNPDARGNGLPGLIRGGFWDEEPLTPPECNVVGNYRDRGPDVFYTCNHYDITVTEPRIASYLGIAFGQIPREHYFATNRTFPASCDWSWLEQQPTGVTRTYLGVPVYEGAYTYRGTTFVPSWGGDMFEALMPDLFVPEDHWGPRSWGRNHPATVRGQIEHGMNDAKYGYWGFSPASNPFGGYGVYGVEAMGMDPGGYPSDKEGTNYDPGFGTCRPPGPPVTYGDGVVTPHAVFLAMRYAPRESVDTLAKLKRNLGAYGPGGFYDSVAVRSGTVARRHLSLDQAMVMGGLGNVLARENIRRAFSSPDIERALRPLMAMEEFSVPARQ
jgi:hypothetical protein